MTPFEEAVQAYIAVADPDSTEQDRARYVTLRREAADHAGKRLLEVDELIGREARPTILERRSLRDQEQKT